jgi:hypothetical protein
MMQVARIVWAANSLMELLMGNRSRIRSPPRKGPVEGVLGPGDKGGFLLKCVNCHYPSSHIKGGTTR